MFDILIIRAGTPNIKNIFAMFDPTMFPKVIPWKPFKAEFTEIANSGADVPKATKVTAITNG